MSRLMTTREIADHLRLSPDKVRELAKSGRIPTVPLARKLLFDPEAVSAAIRPAASAPGPQDAA